MNEVRPIGTEYAVIYEDKASTLPPIINVMRIVAHYKVGDKIYEAVECVGMTGIGSYTVVEEKFKEDAQSP